MIYFLITLAISIIILYFTGAVFIFYKTQFIEAKWYFIGFGIFFLLFGMTRIFFLINDLIYPNEFIWFIGSVLGVTSVIGVLFAIEKQIITQTRFALTITAIITIILYIIPFPQQVHQVIQLISVFIITIILPILYSYIAIKSVGEARKQAIIFFIAVMVFLFGILFHTRLLFENNWIIYHLLNSVFLIIAGGLFLYGFIKQPEEEQ